MFSNTLFIQGTTDNTILTFLKDVELLDDFKEYLKNTFGDDNIDLSGNIKMIDIKDVKPKEDEIKTEFSKNNEISGETRNENKENE